MKHTLIDDTDGLPSNNVTCFAQDQMGFFWLGTNEGLARYDGYSIRVFKHQKNDSTSISSNKIVCMATTPDGIIWIGTADKGLCRFDPRNNEFQSFEYSNKDSTSISDNKVISLHVDPKGRLWVGLDGTGLCWYKPETESFERLIPPDMESTYTNRQSKVVHSIITDIGNDDLLWVTTLDGLWKIELSTRKWTFCNDEDILTPDGEKIPISFRQAIQVQGGKIYITSFRRGVFVFDPIDGSWRRFTQRVFDQERFEDNNFHLIQQKDSSTFWIGSRTRGMSILDLESGYVELLGNCQKNDPDDLCGFSVNAMEMDDHGTHWIATNQGFRIYHRRKHLINSLHTDVSTVHLKGRLYIRTIYPLNSRVFYYGGYAGEGVYKYDLDQKRTTLISPPIGHRPNESKEMFWVNQLIPYRGHTLLVVTAYGLYTLDTISDKITAHKSNLNDKRSREFFHHITHHSNGRYYLSTRHNGVFVLDTALQVIDNLTHDPSNENSLVTSNYVFGSCEDPDGKLWIGTEEGFSVYNPVTGNFDNFDYRDRLDSVPVLKGVLVIKLHPDSSLWFVDSNAGLAVLKYPYKKPYQFEIIGTENGLANEQANNVLFDAAGRVWVSNKDAVSLLNSDGKFLNYTAEFGIGLMRPLCPMVELPSGVIAIGARKDLMLLDPKLLLSDKADVSMYLGSFKVYGKELDDKMNYLDLKEVTLTYKENFFSIDIGTINYSHIDDLNIWYRLKGFNDGWTPLENGRTAIFTNVPGGTYTFEAKTVDQNLNELADKLSLNVEIIPPFWKTWWFIPLVALVLLSLLFAFYSMRIRSIRTEAKLKADFSKRIANVELSALRAQMNPHFLFNSLNSIRHHIITNSTEKADEYLVKFSRLVRLVLQNSRSQLIPLLDEIEALSLYIDLEKSRFDHKFSSHIHVAADIDSSHVQIPPMIIQPFVENAIWHGLMQKKAPGRVEIKISKNVDRLNITVQDDGVGRLKAREIRSKSALQQESMGINITGNRLEIIEKIYNIQCDVKIEDLYDSEMIARGTCVTINLPIIYGTQDSDY